MTIAALLAALEGPRGELEQALAVLRAAGHADPEALEVGEADRRLLAALQDATGAGLELTARCPVCAALNAAAVTAGDVPPARPRCATLGPGGGVRQPTGGDLLGLPDDEPNATDELLRRCVAGRPAQAPRPEHLALVDDALTGPIELTCVECGEPLTIDIDLQAVVLERLARHARALDHEIHLIASAYHWTLAEIRALPDAQRSGLARLVAEER